jgi:peroxiredoxin Q/BCP
VILVGDAAPDFVLRNGDGKDVRLSNFSGQSIVLYFYPKDHTPGCTVQAKRFRDVYEEIASHGAVVVGVSLDDSDSHCKFQAEYHLPFHLLSDVDGRVHDLYAAWRTTLLGKNALGVRRCTYLIDGDGIIRKTYHRVNVLTHAKQVVQDLGHLTAQRQWGKKDARLKDLQP